MSETKPKPFLRWAGSKKKVIPILSEYWRPNFRRYVEPFMGSSVLFFYLKPEKAILSDINSELVDTYAAVKRNAAEIQRALTKMQTGKRAYNKIRSLDPKKLRKTLRAARFIYLNRFCFNGIYRTNKQGKFNVPYSDNPRSDLPTREELTSVSKALRKTKLICADFQDVVNVNVRRGDFVYLDPPYAVQNRKIFRQYGPQTFGLNDLSRLDAVLHEIDGRGAHFLLSYAYCKEAKEIFRYWDQRRIRTTRNIAGFSEYRRQAVEILATNIA